MAELLLFGRWNMDVEIRDPGLERYIDLRPVIIPHTEGRHFHRWFGKANVNIIERFTNNLMRTSKYTGKKAKALDVLEDAFAAIEKKTEKNPVQILIQALEHAAPREEVTRLRYGGISVPKAVDIAPARRLDIAIRNLATGSVRSSHKSKRSMADCVVNELLRASKGEPESFAVGKKDEMERIAASAR